MYTTINFVVDTSSLPSPGTFESPAGTQHYNMVVDRDQQGPHTVSADTPVRVGSRDRVDIALVDQSLGLNVEIAPVMLVVHSWNSVIQQPSDLEDSNPNKPIDKPRFDVNHHYMPKMHYAGSESAWLPVEPGDHLYWQQGAKIREDVTVEKDDLYRPYMTFNFQGLTGLLEYGIEFAVSRDGETIGYYYFDPKIQAG